MNRRNRRRIEGIHRDVHSSIEISMDIGYLLQAIGLGYDTDNDVQDIILKKGTRYVRAIGDR